MLTTLHHCHARECQSQVLSLYLDLLRRVISLQSLLPIWMKEVSLALIDRRFFRIKSLLISITPTTLFRRRVIERRLINGRIHRLQLRCWEGKVNCQNSRTTNCQIAQKTKRTALYKVAQWRHRHLNHLLHHLRYTMTIHNQWETTFWMFQINLYVVSRISVLRGWYRADIHISRTEHAYGFKFGHLHIAPASRPDSTAKSCSTSKPVTVIIRQATYNGRPSWSLDTSNEPGFCSDFWRAHPQWPDV